MLKVSSFWRGFSRSTKLDNTYTSEELNNKGHSFPSSLLCHVALANTYLKYSYTQMCRWVGIFQKSYDPIVMTLLVTGEECYLDFSSWSCTYPTLVSIEPLEVKIISIFLYKNDNCPTLFWAFIIDNSSFLTTACYTKMLYVVLFSVKKFLIYKFKLLSLLKRLCSMSSTSYIHNPLPVTPWRHSLTQTWPTKPLQYLSMKF